ncbi:MAG: 1-acyl-sn-glycerol-3-phosphate acyltransferase [Firmicutes bacterium]|jgi:1-acyl-sn-glycerol-3-phosphate acyltransferase|nr:1-acyl-sn-glycerol-3-phosphate acyltransferase [Bacillota bacterium]
MSFYSFFLNLISFFLKIFWRPNFQGQENIPDQGAVILCANHLNAKDPFFIAMGLPRKIRFLAKEELFRNRILRFILLKSEMIPVKRGQTDRTAVRSVLNSLKAQEMVGIFPEGTRSDGLEMKGFHEGAVYFAQKTGAPLLPAAIIGDYSLFKPIEIVYGQIIEVEKETRAQRAEMQRINEKLKTEIEKLRGINL